MAEHLDRIPMLDLRPEIEEQWDELMEAIQRVLRSGQFILGPEVEAFEHEVAEYLGVKHAIGVNSGTDALVISLRALGIGPGDEVITTPFTFFATAESISNVGAAPVLVDIDPVTFNIDPELIEPAITERTKAILPVHLFGLPCDMDPIMDIALRYGLKVIEDVAQAMGASYKRRKTGTFGDAAAFSFFPSKNLGGFGDGGMVVTGDDEVAGLSRMLRTHGSKRKYENEMLGYNSRLDEVQAAILRIRLQSLDLSNSRRVTVARWYQDRLKGLAIGIPIASPGVRHVFHQYTVRAPSGRRQAVRECLLRDGVSTAPYYPTPCQHLPAYAHHPWPNLPRSEVAAQDALSLPISPRLTEERVDLVCVSLHRALTDAPREERSAYGSTFP